MRFCDLRLIRRRSGFTLIELLVVIAVIAVLMAILLPSLRKAKALTKRMTCQSNLKQVAAAWSMYLDDNEGRFYQNRNANLNYGGWRGMTGWSPRPLNHYFNIPVDLPEDPNTKTDADIFCCPADRGGVPGYAVREKAYDYLGTSYQTNVMLIGQNQLLMRASGQFAQFMALHEEINKRLVNLTLSRVGHHSRLLLIGDCGWINQWKPIPHPREDWKELAEWHDRPDFHNVAFLDGHVGFLNIRKGFYVTDEYTVLPFEELYGMARGFQEQLP